MKISLKPRLKINVIYILDLVGSEFENPQILFFRYHGGIEAYHKISGTSLGLFARGPKG